MTVQASREIPAPQPVIANTTVRNAFAGGDVTLCHAYWAPQGAEKGIVVAVHGLTRQKRDFDYIARFLSAQGYGVYAVDAPGRGGSGWLATAEDYNLFNFADIFAAWLRERKMPKVHWLGTSMGGLLAMVMAIKGDAHFFRTLTLNDITHKPNRAALDRISTYMTDTLPVFASPDQYAAVLRMNLPLGPVPEEVWAHYAENQLVKKDNGYTFHFDPKMSARAAIDLKLDIDLGEAMAKISCPVALIAGSVSDLCGEEEIKALQLLKPDLALHIVQGAGHVPALADDATQQFILEQLARG